MDKKEALASYNSWKQNYKLENEDTWSDQDSTGWNAFSIQLSYLSKDGRPKGPSKISKSILQTRRAIEEKSTAVRQNRLFRKKDRHKDQLKEISILPTINEISNNKSYDSGVAKDCECSATESSSQLLDDTNIAQIRIKDTDKDAKCWKNEKKSLTHWENVIYGNISSEKFRLYFVYFAIFVTLASAFAASISAVRGIYMKGNYEYNENSVLLINSKYLNRIYTDSRKYPFLCIRE